MASNDGYANIGDDLLSPASRAYVVAPSDTAPLPTASKRLYVGAAGTVKLTTVGGSTVAYTVPVGGYLYVRAAQVFATGTSASPIICET